MNPFIIVWVSCKLKELQNAKSSMDIFSEILVRRRVNRHTSVFSYLKEFVTRQSTPTYEYSGSGTRTGSGSASDKKSERIDVENKVRSFMC